MCCSIKTVDILTNEAPFMGTSGNYQTLNLVIPGTSFWNRVNNRIKLESVHLKGFIKATTEGFLDPALRTLRIMVIYDRQPNSLTSFDLTELLQNTNFAGTQQTADLSFTNIRNNERFWVLMDHFAWGPHIQQVDPEAPYFYESANSNGFRIDRFIRLKGLETVYGANNGNISDITTGLLLLVLVSSPEFSSTPFTFEYSARLKFFD